jgi:hypothetical protein
MHCRSYPAFKAYVIVNIMAEILPKILAKSSIRSDLVEYFRTTTSMEAYLKDLITPAITRYISVSNFIAAHPLALPILRGPTVLQISPNSCGMSDLR